jgi:LEA14-like dessication related protein
MADSGKAENTSLASYFKGKEQSTLPSQSRRRRCRCALIWCVSLLIAKLLITGLLILIFWLVVQPKTPQFHVQDAHISVVPIDASTVNVTTFSTIMVRNPNKHLGIYYNNIHVNVQKNGVSLSQGSIPSIYQGHGNVTYFAGDLNPQNVTLSPDIQAVIREPTNVPLYARVDVTFRVKLGSLKSPWLKVYVHCDLTVDLTSTTGSQILTEHCKFHL